MASQVPRRVMVWSFRETPPGLQRLFPEGQDPDWVVHVPESQRPAVEPSLLQWQQVYPVTSAELEDRSIVYCGAPREALQLISKRGNLVTGSPHAGAERRTAVRVRLDCPSRYETHGEPKQIGRGHTIDMSRTGVYFTTESSLPRDTQVTLYVTWPVRLAGDVAVQLRAEGRLARAEATKAAMQLDGMSFTIV